MIFFTGWKRYGADSHTDGVELNGFDEKI